MKASYFRKVAHPESDEGLVRAIRPPLTREIAMDANLSLPLQQLPIEAQTDAVATSARSPGVSPLTSLAGAMPPVACRTTQQAITAAKIEVATLIAHHAALTVERDARKVRLIRRADRLWAVDRQAEIALIADRINGHPHSIVCRLKQTYHGCQHLVTQWNYLREAAESEDFDGALTSADRNAALTLLGIPKFQRHLPNYPIDPDPTDRDKANPGAVERTRAKILALVETQTKRLEAYIEVLVEEDREQREFALKGIFLVPDCQLDKLERQRNRDERMIHKLNDAILGATEDDDNDLTAATRTKTSSSVKPTTDSFSTKTKTTAHPLE